MEAEQKQEEKKVLNIAELSGEMAQFTGTEQYHRCALSHNVMTDGVAWLCNRVGCHWFIDIINSYQNAKVSAISFQIWRLETTRTAGEFGSRKGAIVSMKQDTNAPVEIKQVIEYTDFPDGVFECYLIDGVILLKSEY